MPAIGHRALPPSILLLVRRIIVKPSPVAVLLSVILALGESATIAPAQSPGAFAPISGFDLVAPGVGWAASSSHLYWTVSNGRRWRDITPPRASDDEPIQLAYFTNRLRGWALLINAIENQPASLEIENTINGGASWKLVTVDLSHTPIDPSVPPSIDSISFSDPAHGWILIGTSSASVRGSVLVVTADAGRHWRILRALPMDGNISFSSPANGVLTVSSPDGNAPVWHTQDGGRSWKASGLPAPANCANCVPAHVDSAHFSNANRAVLTAMVKTPGRDDLSSIEYVTANGGTGWTPTGPSAQPRIDADLRRTILADGHVIGMGAAPHNSLVLNINGSRTAITLPPSLKPGAIDRLSVASNRTAWALFSASQTNLVSIDPRGKSARVITPRPSRIERPAIARHRHVPKELVIHCTLVSVRANTHNQAASNDIIRANAALRTR